MSNPVPMTANVLGGPHVVGDCSRSRSALRFLGGLHVPEGPLAGRPLKLAPYQKAFVRGALADGVDVGCLSVGRGNAKSMLAAGLALASLIGVTDKQPRRDIILAARTREQATIVWNFVVGLTHMLADDLQARFTYRRAPRLDIEYEGEHTVRVIAADGKTALGSSPTLVVMDERGHWETDKGDALEHALMSGLGKRNGRALIISTSASDDSHPFSRWLDSDRPGVYRQEHRPSPGLPADDRESLIVANPGAPYHIGSSLEWLEAQARRSIEQGGSTLTAFRLFNRNERVSGETRDLLLTVDQWLACETADLPPREGQCVVGIDLGGSASMSAAAFYWPSSGRLEALGTFPAKPSLLARGQRDAVGNRYVEMQRRGELTTLGDATVPVAPWLVEVERHVEGETIAALVMDRYKQSELGEAIDKAGIRAPLIWRGMGYRDGGEDCERFRRACYDGRVLSAPSLLMRSAMADAVCLRDPANNLKLAKARSNGRIDAVAAAVLAVAEGARQSGRAQRPKRQAQWV